MAEARQLLQESWHLCREMKYKGPLLRVCTYLAETALWEGDLEQTAHWLAQSLVHSAHSQKITIYEVAQLWVAGRLATAQQQYLRAATIFGLADQAHSQTHYVIGGPIRSLADVALATVRAALDPLVFAEAFTRGQQIPLTDVFTIMFVQAPT